MSFDYMIASSDLKVLEQRVLEHFSHAPGQRIYFGTDVLGTLKSLLSQQDGCVALFTGRTGAKRSGALDCFENAARQAGRPWRCFDQIEEEPAIDTVNRMCAFLREQPRAQVVAIGGGSVLDAAKAALLMAQSGEDIEEHFGVNRWSQAHGGQDLRRMIAIPTTAGTGSEATAYSNIVDRQKQVKKLIVEEQSVPNCALVAPEFSSSMPLSVTRATGLDALSHLVEGFLNVGADGRHPEANAWALDGIRLAVHALPKVLLDGTCRREMAMAATLGGMTIRYKSTGLPHLCSFSWFGRIPHGIAVALLLPASWRYYLGNPAVAARTMELQDVFPGKTPEAVVDSYRLFLDKVGAPTGLRAYDDITPELLKLTAASAAENRMKLELAPRPVPLDCSQEILTVILNQAY